MGQSFLEVWVFRSLSAQVMIYDHPHSAQFSALRYLSLFCSQWVCSGDPPLPLATLCGGFHQTVVVLDEGLQDSSFCIMQDGLDFGLGLATPGTLHQGYLVAQSEHFWGKKKAKWHLCKKSLWWFTLKSFFRNFIFLARITVRPSLGRRVWAHKSTLSSVLDMSISSSSALTSVSVGVLSLIWSRAEMLWVAINIVGEKDREGPWHETSPNCFTPLLPSRDIDIDINNGYDYYNNHCILFWYLLHTVFCPPRLFLCWDG